MRFFIFCNLFSFFFSLASEKHTNLAELKTSIPAMKGSAVRRVSMSKTDNPWLNLPIVANKRKAITSPPANSATRLQHNKSKPQIPTDCPQKIPFYAWIQILNSTQKVRITPIFENEKSRRVSRTGSHPPMEHPFRSRKPFRHWRKEQKWWSLRKRNL